MVGSRKLLNAAALSEPHCSWVGSNTSSGRRFRDSEIDIDFPQMAARLGARR